MIAVIRSRWGDELDYTVTNPDLPAASVPVPPTFHRLISELVECWTRNGRLFPLVRIDVFEHPRGEPGVRFQIVGE